MNNTNFKFSSTDGLTLFGRAWISPQPKPKGIVHLVHGLGEHSGRYVHIGEALSEAGYHLMAFDLRGHGLSEGKRGYIPDYDHLLEDIQHFIHGSTQQVPNNLPSFLYGHSLGGALVINYVLRRINNMVGVIVTSPLLATAFDPPKVKILAAKLMAKTFPAFTLKNGLETEALSRDQAVVKAYLDDVYVHDLLSARLGMDMLENGQDALKSASDWKLPLLLMHGTADRITSHLASQEFAEKAGDMVDLVLWQDYYHEIHNDIGAEKVIIKIITWLDENINK